MKIESRLLTSIFLMFFTSLTSTAGDLSVFSVNTIDKNSFVLKLTNIKESKVQVTLKDMEGVTLHDETLIQNNLQGRKYDIQELPSGNYTLIVAYEDVIKIQPIEKEFGKLEIKEDDIQTIFQPTFRQHETYLDLNMLCLADMNISLEIKDSEGHIIFSELLKEKGSIQRRFNLSLLNPDSYTFTLEIMDPVLNKAFQELIEWSDLSTVVAL